MIRNNGKQIIINARFLTQPVTGVQRFAIELSLRLKDRIPNLTFVSPKNILQKDIAEILNVHCFGNLTSHFWEQLELSIYLKKKGSPLLINLCNTAPLFHKKNIICIHDIAFHVNPKWFTNSFVQLYKFLIPKIARASLQVITVSNFSKQEIINYINITETKIETIYNGIADVFLKPAESTDLSEYKDYILAVSSIDPRKNLITLVKAFKKLNRPNISLLIVGAESKVFADSTLKEEIYGCSSIIFTGYLPDEKLAELYQNALMFVYPSLYEGFGIPPLEAMACGCPTIVSNTTALPEICGDASLYVNPLDISDLIDKINLLLSDKALRDELQINGYRQIKHFSWEDSASKLAAISKRFLSGLR